MKRTETRLIKICEIRTSSVMITISLCCSGTFNVNNKFFFLTSWRTFVQYSNMVNGENGFFVSVILPTSSFDSVSTLSVMTFWYSPHVCMLSMQHCSDSI